MQGGTNLPEKIRGMWWWNASLFGYFHGLLDLKNIDLDGYHQNSQCLVY